jgi:hypothetical protein
MKASTAFLLGLGAAALVIDPDALEQATRLLEQLARPVAKAAVKEANKEARK